MQKGALCGDLLKRTGMVLLFFLYGNNGKIKGSIEMETEVAYYWGLHLITQFLQKFSGKSKSLQSYFTKKM